MTTHTSPPALTDVLNFAGFVAIAAAFVVGAPRLAQRGTDRMVSDCLNKGGKPEWVKPQSVSYRPVSDTFRCAARN